jgi:hypothetical protein
MADGILINALREFELALDELAGNLEFVRVAKQLRPRLGGMLDWGRLDGEARNLATSFMKQRTVEESLLYRGLVVSLAGAFEQFIRRVLRDSISAINGSAQHYDHLREEIRRQNTFRTGIALQSIFEPPDYLDLDYELLAKNIGTCFTGSRQVVLNADAFTIFVSIISPDKLAEALKHIGIKMNWDDLGRIDAMREVLERHDTRETAKALQESLKRFGRIRNKVAHSGSGGVVVTETDLEQLLRFFRTFASSLTSIVDAELAESLKK